jgi:hypothetical protein
VVPVAEPGGVDDRVRAELVTELESLLHESRAQQRRIREALTGLLTLLEDRLGNA